MNKEIKFKNIGKEDKSSFSRFANARVVEKILSPNEEIKYQFSLGERYLKIKKIMTIVLGFIVLLSIGLLINHFFEIDIRIIILIIGALLVLLILISLFYFDWYLKRANIYLITNRRIIIHRGWLSAFSKSVDFRQITDIKIIQSFTDRIIFNMGTLKINTAGMEDYAIIFYCVEDPYNIKTKILEMKYSSLEQLK
jgi:hypothetical protein